MWDFVLYNWTMNWVPLGHYTCAMDSVSISTIRKIISCMHCKEDFEESLNVKWLGQMPWMHGLEFQNQNTFENFTSWASWLAYWISCRRSSTGWGCFQWGRWGHFQRINHRDEKWLQVEFFLKHFKACYCLTHMLSDSMDNLNDWSVVLTITFKRFSILFPSLFLKETTLKGFTSDG